MFRKLLAPRMDASPPQEFESLRVKSIAALRERGDIIVKKGAGFNGDTTTLLRMLAGLVTAKILDERPTILEGSSPVRGVTIKVPPVYAGHVACAIRTLMDLNVEFGNAGVGASWDTVEQIRVIVALREYAQGETDPQVVREMWLLQEALVGAGEYEKAQEVELDVFRRLEKYVQDIPVAST